MNGLHLRHSLARTLACAALSALPVTPAGATDPATPAQTEQAVAPATAAPLSGMTALTDQEMADAHGGFDWAGMNITFGADIQTYLNGQLALQTLVNWTATGASTTQTVVGEQLTAATMGQLTGGGINIPASIGNSPVYFANAGQTALVQNANGALQNILVNTMNNLNAVQQTNATITLGNYTAFASALHMSAIGTGLSSEIGRFSH